MNSMNLKQTERSIPLFIIPGPDDLRRTLGTIHRRHLVNHKGPVTAGVLHVGTVPIHGKAAAAVRDPQGEEVVPILFFHRLKARTFT